MDRFVSKMVITQYVPVKKGLNLGQMENPVPQVSTSMKKGCSQSTLLLKEF